MSWLPLCNSILIFFALVSLFLWKLWAVLCAAAVSFGAFAFLVAEAAGWKFHSSFGFWLFVGSEVIIFLSLFLLVLYNEAEALLPVSARLELPFLGSFLLIGSSISVSCYHHCVGTVGSGSALALTLLLGVSFVLLQLLEFYECGCDLPWDPFYCASFCTVGLHFLHVVVGLVLLSSVLVLLPRGLNFFYGDLAVWYWHFVDYMWLLVYFVVYCSGL